MTIAFRPLTPIERPFVRSGWSSSFKESKSAGMICDEDWATVMHAQIDKVLDRPDAVTLVAYETTEADTTADLYGFIVCDPARTPPLVWFVYVKAACRNLGIARGLFKAAGIDPMRPHAWACATSVAWRLKDLGKVAGVEHEPRLGRIQKHNLVPLELRRGRTRRRRAVPVTILRKQ